MSCQLIYIETALVRLENRRSPSEWTLEMLTGYPCFGSLSLCCISPCESGFAQIPLRFSSLAYSECTYIKLFHFRVIISKIYKKVWEIERDSFMAYFVIKTSFT